MRSTEGTAGSNASLQARTAGRNLQVVPPPSGGFGFSVRRSAWAVRRTSRQAGSGSGAAEPAAGVMPQGGKQAEDGRCGHPQQRWDGRGEDGLSMLGSPADAVCPARKWLLGCRGPVHPSRWRWCVRGCVACGGTVFRVRRVRRGGGRRRGRTGCGVSGRGRRGSRGAHRRIRRGGQGRGRGSCGAGGHVVNEDGERCRQVVCCPFGEESDELAELPSGFGCGEQRVGAYGPDPVAGVFGVGVEDEPVGGGGVADGDDVQVGQDLRVRVRRRGAGRWLVVAGQPEA